MRATLSGIHCARAFVIFSAQNFAQCEVLGSKHLFSKVTAPDPKEKVPNGTQKVTDLHLVELRHRDLETILILTHSPEISPKIVRDVVEVSGSVVGVE